MGTSFIRNRPPLGPYSRTKPLEGPMVALGGGAVSYERGTPVGGSATHISQSSVETRGPKYEYMYNMTCFPCCAHPLFPAKWLIQTNR